MKKLNLGCGEDYKKGWINLDCRNDIKTDIKWDVNRIPYPFKDNTFNEVLMKMILEHAKDPIRILKEIIRISKKNSKIIVIVPHAGSYAAKSDLQHKNFFTENTFDEWHLLEYGLTELKLIKKEFLFKNKWKRYIPFKRYFKIYLNGIYDDLLFKFENLK
ncbi:MAG: methyltransferase domain-containing protein [Candidatus Nanoarchaeia archaeon]|nr:methyltransferase domain-containing protein [Candidatus Nanoarchaeia archaeon]MDD5741435.1 methyltransferase domain-containing protein [Candidatus Nanoarchaeia archaeon]